MTIEQAVATLREVQEGTHRLPTEDEIAAAEQQLGLSFPPDYRYFLLNAGDIEFGTLEPARVTTDIQWPVLVDITAEGRDIGLPEDLLPICEDNADYYCIAPDGRVVFWSHNGTTDESWDDLATWITDCWIGEEMEDRQES